jgi:dihydrofolate reductase
MARLIYSMLCSLDGYIEDADGGFDWLTPSPETHAFVNDVERGIGTYLYGRRLYETMTVWETDPSLASETPEMADYAAIWVEADKIVYSSTLAAVSTSRTELRRQFDADEVGRLMAASDRDITIGGPTLAAHAFAADLVDEVSLYVVPVIVGGGKRVLPADVRLDLDLIQEHRFGDGTMYLRYQRRGS